LFVPFQVVVSFDASISFSFKTLLSQWTTLAVLGLGVTHGLLVARFGGALALVHFCPIGHT
jgi:hypothetical protein